MSTPPGKARNPIAHVSQKARERAVTEPNPSEDESDPFLSPYAPKQARERAGTEWHPVQNARDPLGSPYTPPKAGAVRSDFAAGDDAGPLPPVRAPEGLRPERYAEPHLRSRDASGGGHVPERPLSNERNGGDHSPNAAAAGERSDEIMSDHDLERLEASLRWLQRQESATRLPRATNLATVSGLAPVDASGRRHSRERFDAGFRSPRPLEPERLPPPPTMPRRNIGALVGIVVASILVATTAYYFAEGGWGPSSEPAPGPQTASFDPTVVAPPFWPTGQQARRPTMPQDNDHAPSAQSEISSQSTNTSRPVTEGHTVAMVQPGEPGIQVPPASKATRVLDPEEIKLLMKQGEQFIAAGDVVTARLVLQRAAEAGYADAALALGGTYDPIMLAKLGVVGLGTDVEKARAWYQKAESLGSTEATRRLAVLANR